MIYEYVAEGNFARFLASVTIGGQRRTQQYSS